jgi:glycosyltransferase involved in cell wall biosynthesis
MPEHRPAVLLAVEQLRRRVPGGIGTYARGLLAGLASCTEEGQGAEVTLLASRRPGARASGPDGDPLARFGFPLRTSRLPGPLLTRAWDHALVRAPRGFDVVHAVSLAAPRPSNEGTPLVVTVHDLAWRLHPDATTRRGRTWHEAALARARMRAAALVTPSRRVAADLEALGADPARISVVPPGSDLLPPPDAAGADALLGRLGVPGPFVLTVGTLEPRKNLGRLVEAYATVRPSLPEHWPLVVVGPTGWRGGGGDRGAPQVPTQGVVFAGAVRDDVLAELYRRARVLAYVPLAEGFGLPPFEAMRLGTPALVARGVPSVDDVGDSPPAPARLVDPFDVGDIAAGLAAVLTDEALRADLAARGEAHARSRTWRAAAAAHVALWESLR